MLVAEDQNLMIEMRLMHARKGLVVERFRQIQTNDFRAERRRQRVYLKAHFILAPPATALLPGRVSVLAAARSCFPVS